jgi:hypothetical protein
LSPPDLVSHFAYDRESMENSGLLVLAPHFDKHVLDFTDYLLQGEDENFDHRYRIRDLTEDEFSDEFRFTNPTYEHMDAKCSIIEQNESNKDPLHRYRIKVTKKDFRQIGGSWLRMTWKYTYGSATLYQTPLTIRQTLFGMQLKSHEPDTILPIFGIDSQQNLTFINTDTLYFKLFYAIISSLSLLKKLEILKSQDEERPQELNLIKELVAESIYRQLKKELNIDQNLFTRLDYILSLFHTNKELCMNVPVLYGVLVIMHRLEASTYWRSWVPELGIVTSLISSTKSKREKLISYRIRFEKELVACGEKVLFDVKSVIEQAERYASLRRSQKEQTAKPVTHVPASVIDEKKPVVKHLLE